MTAPKKRVYKSIIKSRRNSNFYKKLKKLSIKNRKYQNFHFFLLFKKKEKEKIIRKNNQIKLFKNLKNKNDIYNYFL